jgi:hypothetical protein
MSSMSNKKEKYEESFEGVFNLDSQNREVANVEDDVELIPYEDEEVVDGRYEEDFETARENMKSIIIKGEEILDSNMNFVKFEESAKGYDSLAKMVKELADANIKLLRLHQQKKIHNKQEGSSQPQTVNNTLIMTSEEMRQRLKR